jgi:lipopolysaccharide export system protein LptA
MSVSEGWKARSRKKCAIKLSFFLFISFFLINSTSYAEEIQFKADSMTGVSGSKTDETKLSGNAFVKTSTMEIKADSITLDGEDFRYITAQGSVEGKNTETKMDFTCGKLRYDRNTKLARLEDGVHMVDLENSVTIDSQIIEYNQSKEIATMQIGVSIKQKDNTCTSAFAIYRKGAQMLEMSGNPKIIQGADTFRAQEIILNLNSQEITLRDGSNEVNEVLTAKLNERLQMAGLEVIEARINYLAYAPEIAAVMLRRQQAAAIITAREKIVDGAVSMVKLALDKLADEDIVDLDEEKKAAMVSNLLVVLCADEPAQPVINSGTLNH